MFNIHGLCNGHYVRRNLTIEHTTVQIDFEVAYRASRSYLVSCHPVLQISLRPSKVAEDPNYQTWCSLQRQP